MANYNLPDITFAEKDSATIETEIVSQYEETAGVTLADADPRKKLLQAEVPIITGQRAVIDRAAKQNLLAYASDDFLDHLGVLVGTPRLKAAAAKTTERFTLSTVRSQPTTIAAGKRVTAGDNIFFVTITEGIIPAGQLSVDIKVECMETGTKGNGYEPGALITLVDPIPYIDSVTNITASEGGTDREEDDAYRDRIQQAPERFSVAGPDGAYIYWAKTASTNIVDVKPFSPSPGEVHICVLLAGGEIPGQEILDDVLSICSDKKIRPLTDHVSAVAPEQAEYDIDVQYWISKQNESVAARLRENVEASVQTYRSWQKSALGRDIDPSELIHLMKMAGASRVAVTAPLYQTLTDSQVAKDITVNVNYGGIDT
jgi:phage-related baseplate assembly protein